MRACCTTPSFVKCTIKGGVVLEGPKFVIVAVGDEPTSPLTTTPAPAAPVTPELPSTPNCWAVPSGGATWAHATEGTHKSMVNTTPAARRKHWRFMSILPV